MRRAILLTTVICISLPLALFCLLRSGLSEIGQHWPTRRKALQVAGLTVFALAYAAGTLTQQTYWATDLLLYGRAYKLLPVTI